MSEMINAAEAVSFQFFEGDKVGMNEHVDYRDLLHIKVFLRRKYYSFEDESTVYIES